MHESSVQSAYCFCDLFFFFFIHSRSDGLVLYQFYPDFFSQAMNTIYRNRKINAIEANKIKRAQNIIATHWQPTYLVKITMY